MLLKKSLLKLVPLSFVVILSGCSQHMVRDMSASVVVKFGNSYLLPWFMASDDLDVLCGLGEGLAPVAYPMGPNVDRLIPLVSLAGGLCADERGKEEELRYIKALRRNDAEAAQDARTMQKRWMLLAARREYFGYQAAVRHFGEPGGETCPKFKNKDDEMAYLFGLFVGTLAYMTDFLSAGGYAGVPAETLPHAVKGLKCLDSDTYWGLPNAVDALITIMLMSLGDPNEALPEEREKLTQAYAKLKKASDHGKSQGVRLVQMIEAILYSTRGDLDKTKELIRDHVATKKSTPVDPTLKLLDELATRMITLISDKLWTQHTGQRTPYQSLGTFWDDEVVDEDTLDLDDLF